MKKLIFVDIDETLFFTKAKIYVRNKETNKIVKELSNQEFNTYKLKENEYFSFEEFKSSDIFIEGSIPNKKMINIVNKLYDNEIEIALLTARQDFDNKDTLIEYLKSFGLNIGHYKNKDIHIIRTGNYTEITSTAKRKQFVVEKILKKRYKDFDEIVLYDDNEDNLKEFMKLKDKFENKLFTAFKVEGENIIKYKGD